MKPYEEFSFPKFDTEFIYSQFIKRLPETQPSGARELFDSLVSQVTEMQALIIALQEDLQKSDYKARMYFWGSIIGSFISMGIGFFLGKYFG